MTRKAAIRSMLAYLNHLGPMYHCKHGHSVCAIRRNGVCTTELIRTYPEYSRMRYGELRDELEQGEHND